MADELPRCIHRPVLYKQGLNHEATVPYGFTVDEVWGAMNSVYDTIHQVNVALVQSGNDRIEEIMLGNSFSGFISELVVKALTKNSQTMIRNTKVGGHPDLLPLGYYDTDAVLHGEEGIEVKTSLQPSGWQGHNPEKAWVMVFQYAVDVETEPFLDRMPFQFVRVVLAKLEESDWSFSGRTGNSRRTPTASILKTGTEKLHANPIYTIPGYQRRRTISRLPDQLELVEEQIDPV